MDMNRGYGCGFIVSYGTMNSTRILDQNTTNFHHFSYFHRVNSIPNNSCRSKLIMNLNLNDYSSVISALQSTSITPVSSYSPTPIESPPSNALTIDSITISLETLISETSHSNIYLGFLTHFGDLTSFEYIQRLKPHFEPLKKSNTRLILIGIGNLQQAHKFCELLEIPTDSIYCDTHASCYKALELYPGFAFDQKERINPYIRLLAMLVGIGSPGTLKAVIGGYFGNLNKPVDFWTKSAMKIVNSELFDVLGKGYTRPFEIATIRLQNMIDILPRWSELSPEDPQLLTQQGATFVINSESKSIDFVHRDSGILAYANIEDAIAKAIKSE
mmetsp:Transcript_9318/g.16785  ORF Transcript_9318/g.16785 Transcript_9318/m.16785 type:complete len:330 (+) Transcript_9318:289-1278(+)